MTTFEVVRDVLLLGLGLFGTGLSIFNYIDAKSKDKRQIRVTLSSAIPTYHDGSLGLTYAKLEATNVGSRDVVVSSMFIEASRGGRLTSFEQGVFPGVADTILPTPLSDGHSAHRFYAYRDIGEALIGSGRTGKQTITPVCEDSSGAQHRGEPWEVTPEELLGM
ncbi:hypothetical protein EPK99_24960 [Neorhizobium lilium]|uniref:Uncharacterized protein n=1 Tax=Neorhizobium lilium TaxID=2503024 RepID=A0A444LA33_9HYPH|nr:hypothetical protein [Neorhizobium lilium]RWX74437.1 hypothetical protein EPK99_24960 [Neorhizobium lilium]